MNISEKRKKIEKYLLTMMEQLDANDKTKRNVNYYKDLFKSLNDKQFGKWIDDIKEEKDQIYYHYDNTGGYLKLNELFEVAEKRKVQLFQRYYTVDRDTGREYLSTIEYLVITLPTRRLSQYLFHKISLPESDSKVNPISGQVIKPDKGARVTNVDLQVMGSKGLKISAVELFKFRGGDVNAYNQMKSQILETGEVDIDTLDVTTRPRSVVSAGIIWRCAGIDHNF